MATARLSAGLSLANDIVIRTGSSGAATLSTIDPGVTWGGAISLQRTVTLEHTGSSGQMAELLAALHGLDNTHLIFTMPNADTGSRALSRMINEFVAAHPNARAYTSLGQQRYFSCMRFVDGVVGNSSSGFAEAPSFRIATVNIGDRQKGRLKSDSVIDCEPSRDAIARAIRGLYEPAFRQALASVSNPYGDGGASGRIVEVLRDHPLDRLLKKSFHDLPVT